MTLTPEVEMDGDIDPQVGGGRRGHLTITVRAVYQLCAIELQSLFIPLFGLNLLDRRRSQAISNSP